MRLCRLDARRIDAVAEKHLWRWIPEPLHIRTLLLLLLLLLFSATACSLGQHKLHATLLPDHNMPPVMPLLIDGG